jgi:CubicO group peptidase (beta-lactamase class C family)
LTLVRTPGEAFGYSGEGYVYLQEVVEQLTGRPLHEYMDRDVLSPLGMTASSYVWREPYGTLAATGHRSDGRPYRKERPACGNAAASLHTTPREFARFLSQVLNSRDQSRSESEVDIGLMLTPQMHLSGDLWWTLGWGLQQEADDELIWHWGDNPGFKSFAAARLRERRGFVLMMNSDNGIRAWAAVARDVLGMDAEIFDWLGDAFYSNQASRSPAPTRPHRG